MLIGFLIRDTKDWHEWRKSITEVEGKPLIHISDREPIIGGKDGDHQSAILNIETLDNDEEDDGEFIEHP